MSMTLYVQPVLAVISGILILVWPKILNYVVGIYLILFGLLNLMG